MNKIASIRTSIGISQQELAGILGISRSSLSMIEKDRRKLSAEGVVKLGRLELKHISGNQNKKSEEVINEQTKRSFRIFLQEKKIKYGVQLSKYHKQLDEMISINESAKKRKGILQNEFEIYEGVAQYQTQLEKLMMTSEKKINRYDLAQRLRIQFEIAQLEFQLQHIEDELLNMN